MPLAIIWPVVFSPQNVVAFLYLIASLLSYFTLPIYNYQQFFQSLPLLSSIFLFGKSTIYSPIYSFLLVPKRWFRHFYFTAILISLSTLSPLFSTRIAGSLSTRIALMVVVIQTTKRLYESIYVQIFSKSVMSIVHYFVGHYFYLTMPLSIYWTFLLDSDGYFKMGFYFICASVVIMLQHVVMLQLADIRKNVPRGERNTYHVPTGYMFTHVTCPHFALEILLYAIIHLILGLCWLPFTPTFIFVLSNQICSGVINHMWYQKNYSDFAKSRKILIPFVF
ncbi:unnamed protein product [Rodentolepis nana]|uniref:Polyprenal reductase n=1 Tax=Rodentolepis nana TaxID=102285 RepID=A0A0R3TUM1_RODNA|nr:unnamed protein product [Rodentolepis nana]